MARSATRHNISDVQRYWDGRPCNIRHSPKPVGSKEYFDEVEARKYLVEPHIPGFAEFERWRGKRVLEVGCGIGTDSINFARAGAELTAVDLSGESLRIAVQRAEVMGVRDRIRFVEANAEKLPLPDCTYDAYSIAFGIRNVPRIDSALREAYRVLRPGGHFLCLEFSSVDVPGLDTIYDMYSFNAIPAIGRVVTGDAESYRYLVESIRKFPKPEVFASMIRDAGFSRVSYTKMTGGIVALHSGWRL